MATSSPAAGWYGDPTARHEYRYWNGANWTAQVSDRGTVGTDAAVQSAPVVTAPASAPAVAPTTPAQVFPVVGAPRAVIATDSVFTIGSVMVVIGVIVYLITGSLSYSLHTQVSSGSTVSDTTFAIGTKGDPLVTGIYTAGIVLPLLAFVALFLLPASYRLPRAARAQWGGGGTYRWAPWTRNYSAYLKEHLGTKTLYKRSLLGRLIAMTVIVVALVGLAVLNAANATNKGCTLRFGAYALIGGGTLALVGVLVSWLGTRRTVHVDGSGRLVDA
jgi:hypothetical protein